MTPDDARQNNTENGMDGTPEECDHIKRNICLCDWGDDCPMNIELDFTYCPKCGEKLEEDD